MTESQKSLEISLYLHIPFCDSKCGYCAFNSEVNKNHLKILYMTTLAKYISHKFKEILKNTQHKQLKITSVYIGGGTPSVIQPHLYESIFAEFMPLLKPQAEISIEANPDSLTLEWLSTLKSLGVNRLSLGVQSFESKKLAFLERNHNIESTYNAIEIALKVGLDNLNIDLIYGTPFCNRKLLEYELEVACSLPLSHISAYHLSLDEGSRLYHKYKKNPNGFFILNPSEEFEDFLSIGHFVSHYLKKAGFWQYEVSNYTKAKPSYHNLRYWEGKEYLGIGAGAVGYTEGTRTTMPKNIERFLSSFNEEKEILTPHNQLLEHLFLGFRSCVGVEAKRIPNIRNLGILLNENKVEREKERIYAKDYFLGDEIALFVS
ncbi:radical SAM family heme chaperone HemW [uncultured Helicobacter sp.]|uniref:radical SAM family heme chaperone HemW n=1 Tax=uncultured Helicobacter sp. TaxID=175537 RepID=UPI0026380DC3|nr:radical SAM family heme chaperone HemW [uncultured Helicobacter sp.]